MHNRHFHQRIRRSGRIDVLLEVLKKNPDCSLVVRWRVDYIACASIRIMVFSRIDSFGRSEQYPDSRASSLFAEIAFLSIGAVSRFSAGGKGGKSLNGLVGIIEYIL